MASAQLVPTSTPRLFGGVVGGWVLVSGVPARCWVLRDRTLHLLPVVGGGVVAVFSRAFLSAGVSWWVGECRPYFENYTVDASIFKMILRDCFVIDDLKDH